MLLDGIDVGPPPPPLQKKTKKTKKKKKNYTYVGVTLIDLFMKYEQYHKCKGSLKTSVQWKCKIWK